MIDYDMIECYLQSMISERKANALDASFIHAPVGEDVEWRLTATIAPCHVTVIFICSHIRGILPLYK